jgi:hypothetical protein
MVGRLIFTAFAIAAWGIASPAGAAESCLGYKQLCEAACTPARISRFYSDHPPRCSASCEPRFYECVRTGIWVHLEDSRAGWREPVNPF